ncbi:MAG: hypothetical protein CMO66_06325 [Verrucomicrobiales bacterium]|nr:hypothetical protein [Verrucomicrobiales bacterium]
MFARLVALFLAVAFSAQAAPDWIWAKNKTPLKNVTLSHQFEVPAKPKSAKLRLIADGAVLRLNINGKPVAIAEPFGPVVEIDALHHLKAGPNQITLSGKAVTGIAAAALHLKIEMANGKAITIATSPAWKTTGPKAKVFSTGDLGLEHWWNLPPLVIDEADDYTQWKRASNAKAGTDPATFQLLPRFKATLLHSAQPDENSWVSIAFDPEGRITVGREDKGLIRYTLSANREKIIRAESINDDLRECRGLLYAHGSLYASANNSKGLYRLRDTDGDGTFDEKKLLHTSNGGVGHGRNDLALGPDGKIYVIHGDSIQLPEVTDRMSPMRRKYQPFRMNEGHVLRMDADGSNKEIFCGGLRNPYGIAFNTDGEAFTYDADAEFDMGTPWYRPTQVKHLTSGADFGWRAVTGSWPSYFPDHPDNTQPTLDIGKGSPTGVKFGTGSHFPPKYKKSLFILDWTYGRILAVHLRPRGSTYMGAAEVFLRGEPLNVTDLDFGPDGAMYFVTGGRKTQSALYRVTYTDPSGQPRAATPQETARAKQAEAFRKARRQAEQFHGKKRFTYQPDHPDPRVRHAWRITLEHAGKQVLTGSKPNFENLTTEANLLGDQAKLKLIKDWPSLLPSEQLAYIDLIRRGMERGAFTSRHAADIQKNLQPHFPNTSPSINQALAPLLIQLSPAQAVPQTVKLLDASSNQRERIHYLYHLRHAKTGWSPESRRTFFRILGTYDTFLGGRGLPQALGKIRTEAKVTLTDGEKKRLADVIKQKPQLPPLPDLTGRTLVKQWAPADFNGALDFDAKKRDLANGKKMFAVAMCSRCHRHGREGYPIGPDLTHVASRFGRADLLAEILEPSKTIAENYQTTILHLKDGRELAGQIIPNLDYRAPTLQLAENPLHPDKITRIPKEQIARRRHSDTSLMPPGLVNLLTKKEILNLLAWLERGR